MKKYQIRTKRLIIEPISDDGLEKLIAGTEDEGLKMAYSEMLEAARANESDRIWYVPWMMTLKKEGTVVGDLGFKGPPVNDAVEIGYGVLPEFEGRGYTTEACEAMVNRAFENKSVFFVEAEAEETNGASLRILEKLGFEKYGVGEEGPRFVKEKSKTGSWTTFYMCMGIAIGMTLGRSAFKNSSLGMCIGIAIGAGLGASLDNKEKAAIEEAKKRRSERLTQQ